MAPSYNIFITIAIVIVIVVVVVVITSIITFSIDPGAFTSTGAGWSQPLVSELGNDPEILAIASTEAGGPRLRVLGRARRGGPGRRRMTRRCERRGSSAARIICGESFAARISQLQELAPSELPPEAAQAVAPGLSSGPSLARGANGPQSLVFNLPRHNHKRAEAPPPPPPPPPPPSPPCRLEWARGGSASLLSPGLPGSKRDFTTGPISGLTTRTT